MPTLRCFSTASCQLKPVNWMPFANKTAALDPVMLQPGSRRSTRLGTTTCNPRVFHSQRWSTTTRSATSSTAPHVCTHCNYAAERDWTDGMVGSREDDLAKGGSGTVMLKIESPARRSGSDPVEEGPESEWLCRDAAQRCPEKTSSGERSEFKRQKKTESP